MSDWGPPAGSNGIGDALDNGKLTVVDGELYEFLKSWKTQDFLAEQGELESFYHCLSNGHPVEGDSYCCGGVRVSVKNNPLTKSKALSKSFNNEPATETRSKKRACVTEGMKGEQGNDLFNARRVDDKCLFPDSFVENDRKAKRIRVTKVSCPSEDKSTSKSLEILQDSSLKKGSTHKGGDLKQAKTGAAHMKKSVSPVKVTKSLSPGPVPHVKKSASQVKGGKKNRFPGGVHHVKKSTFQVKGGKKTGTPGRAGTRLDALLSRSGSKVEGKGGELTRKKRFLSWLIDNSSVEEHDTVRYLHWKHLHCMLEGYVTRDGILCKCCREVVSLSVFQKHAGSKLKKPRENIYLNNGKSLSNCYRAALAMKTQNQAHDMTNLGGGSIENDGFCGICGYGGELICCDHCPSSFHLSCMSLEGFPDGDWYCPKCCCASCGESQFNGDKRTFNDLTVIFCDQCEREHHVKCLRDRGLVLTLVPEEDFFCGDTCTRIFQGLRSLLGICNHMEGGFSWTLLRSGAEDDRKSGHISNSKIKVDLGSKLSIALSVLLECFNPMIDPSTKIEMVSHIVYNRRSDVSRLNFHGFYTMVLERGGEVISVATIRVHGTRLAELPLIGTRNQYQRQGMCRRLMRALEEMLSSLGVESLVLPAMPEVVDTWTGAFGFLPMGESKKLQLMDSNIVAFLGTSILCKRLEYVVPRAEAGLLPSVRDIQLLKDEDIIQDYQSLSTFLKRKKGQPPKARIKYNPANKVLS